MEEEEICGLIVKHFEEIFRSSRDDTRSRWSDWMRCVPSKLNDEMRTELTRPYSDTEVREAVFQMFSTKAPGLDGFSSLFYQRSWNLIKVKVSKQIISMINSGLLEEGVNKTLITLIPKIEENPACHHIRESRSFCPRKIISDNIIAAQELIHYIRTRSRQKVGFFALKLDISKAYDRVEWDFLEVMMRSLGFPVEWISMVMSCTKSVSYVVRVNDLITEEIKPGRGIRQGDPLSPFLFLICSEWLNLKVKECQEKGKLRGVKICRGAPEITHMLFADDSVFFLRATRENAASLKKILEEYEVLSGQKVEIMLKYLGLPVAFGHNRTELFRDIIGRIWRKMQGWKEKSLSIAGKEVLIKAVIQAMPTYAMSCFKIPNSLIKRIVSMISNYWWSNSNGGRGIHWCKYRNLCKDKMEGGVGFKDLSIFNDALLAKQIWRLMEKPDNLMRNRPSLVWRSIWTSGQKVKKWIQVLDSGEEVRWTRESDGKFLTKSAYKALKDVRDQSPQTAARYVYQQAWSLFKGEEKFIVTELSDGVRWSNPRRGAVKVNVDGAWDSATRKAGVGISCRDKWGCVRFVEAFPVEGVADCLEVEQLALARAMAIVEEENLINVTFETDSVQVMNGLMRGDSFGGQSRVLLHWCKGRLEDNISWDLSLISKEANECADYLAKKAKREDWSWRSRAAVPLCLSSVLN
ncbi:hypothetical protein QQ045_018033 [Rhodiola kirilowii]